MHLDDQAGAPLAPDAVAIAPAVLRGQAHDVGVKPGHAALAFGAGVVVAGDFGFFAGAQLALEKAAGFAPLGADGALARLEDEDVVIAPVRGAGRAGEVFHALDFLRALAGVPDAGAGEHAFRRGNDKSAAVGRHARGALQARQPLGHGARRRFGFGNGGQSGWLRGGGRAGLGQRGAEGGQAKQGGAGGAGHAGVGSVQAACRKSAACRAAIHKGGVAQKALRLAQC